MSDHDLRRQADDIRRALERYERDQLIDILVHVFRQYVMEGTLGVSLPTAPAAAADELSGLSFAQLVERLQLRLDLPELQYFEVSGARVSVRIDGRLYSLDGSAAPQPPGKLGQVEVSLRQAAPAPAPAPAAAPAAPPAATPTGVGPVSRAVAPTQRPAQPAPAQRPAQPAAPAAQPAAPEKDRPDDGGGRFTLLEID